MSRYFGDDAGLTFGVGLAEEGEGEGKCKSRV